MVIVIDNDNNPVGTYRSDAEAVRDWCQTGHYGDRFSETDELVSDVAKALQLDGWEWEVAQRDRARHKAQMRRINR